MKTFAMSLGVAIGLLVTLTLLTTPRYKDIGEYEAKENIELEEASPEMGFRYYRDSKGTLYLFMKKGGRPPLHQ